MTLQMLYVYLIVISATTHIQLRETTDAHLHYNNPLQLASTPFLCVKWLTVSNGSTLCEARRVHCCHFNVLESLLVFYSCISTTCITF